MALVAGGGFLVFVLLTVILFSLLFKGVKHVGKSVSGQFENERQRIMSHRDGNEAVDLSQDQLADYAAYQAGTALGRDVFIAWNVDRRRTTLGMETFREKAEGATVTWQLKVEDLSPGTETINGNFTIPYHLTEGQTTTSSNLHIRCEFTKDARDPLLTVRRGDWVDIRGRLSLKGDGVVIREARLAGRDAEHE